MYKIFRVKTDYLTKLEMIKYINGKRVVIKEDTLSLNNTEVVAKDEKSAKKIFQTTTLRDLGIKPKDCKINAIEYVRDYQ